VRDPAGVREAMAASDVVPYHAAQVSVPRSVSDPSYNHSVDVDDTKRVLEDVRGAGARVALASSSASHGDDAAVVKREERLGALLSPYAESKTLRPEASA
jgi:UDP-N-acetylglucosamine/UDP-N-acetylgalactosamine 4-epimerase